LRFLDSSEEGEGEAAVSGVVKLRGSSSSCSSGGGGSGGGGGGGGGGGSSSSSSSSKGMRNGSSRHWNRGHQAAGGCRGGPLGSSRRDAGRRGRGRGRRRAPSWKSRGRRGGAPAQQGRWLARSLRASSRLAAAAAARWVRWRQQPAGCAGCAGAPWCTRQGDGGARWRRPAGAQGVAAGAGRAPVQTVRPGELLACLPIRPSLSTN
jgi:hypothetical protein